MSSARSQGTAFKTDQTPSISHSRNYSGSSLPPKTGSLVPTLGEDFAGTPSAPWIATVLLSHLARVSACPAYRDVEVMAQYRYELRRGDDVLATGHLSSERSLGVGERVVIGGRPGIVRSVDPVLGEHELRLVVQLRREDLDD